MTIFEANPDGTDLKPLTHAKGYNAEGSYSPDGKQIVFTSNRDAADSLEIYIMDADGKNVRQVTHAPHCYNGGPFFSPDGKRIIFRSDRKEKDRLQLYVINADGTGEKALTDDVNWVCWAPYWYKDGKHIIYTAADHGTGMRPNYDLYWMDIDTGKKVRVTFAPGADVLPVFSPDYKKADVDLDARRQPAVAAVHRGFHAAGMTQARSASEVLDRDRSLAQSGQYANGLSSSRRSARLSLRCRSHSRRTWLRP